MDASGDIRRKQLEDIERRIDAHPGLVEHLRLGAFAQSLGAVFLPELARTPCALRPGGE